jgi:transcription initiation factor TFIIIB Brf1 subunit/transcription initiation factor TFIIB
MEMNNVLGSTGQNGKVYLNSFSPKNGADYGTAEQRIFKKVKKLDNCLVELAIKLGIKDTAVITYGREYLQDVIPHLIEHFNKKPFIGIAAAVLIVACYKADYPVTNAQIIKASDVKDTIVLKCFHAFKEILLQKKGK